MIAYPPGSSGSHHVPRRSSTRPGTRRCTFAPRHREGPRVDVGGDDPGLRNLRRDRDRHRPAAGAEVRDAGAARFAGRLHRGEHRFHEPLGLRTRDESGAVDLEVERPELAPSGEPRERLAGRPTLDELTEPSPFRHPDGHLRMGGEHGAGSGRGRARGESRRRARARREAANRGPASERRAAASASPAVIGRFIPRSQSQRADRPGRRRAAAR